MRHPIVKIEERYTLSPASDPETTFLSTSLDWNPNSVSYSLSETESPESLSPAASYESAFSSHSQPTSLEEIPYNEDMVDCRLYPFPTHCQNNMQKENAGHTNKRGQHNLKASKNIQRRRKASEREKMRMRAIAEALHNLRSNLPPVYSQGRQPLTKIQTLKCTISYIEELSNLLLNDTKRTNTS